jgi:hypothetical protein
MSGAEPEPIPAARAGVFRAGLLALGAVQAGIGVYALAAPRSFYLDFPVGRAWVAALPDYSEHLVRDVGGLFLATGAVLLAAGWYLERRLVWVALLSFLAFSLPHTVFHLLNLEPYSTADVVGNVVALTATVVIPIGLIYLLVRSPREPAAPPATRAEGDPRIEAIADSTRRRS